MEKNIVYGFCFVFVFVLYYYSFYIVTRTFCLVSILKIEFILEVLKPLILFTIKEETVHTTFFAKKKNNNHNNKNASSRGIILFERYNLHVYV